MMGRGQHRAAPAVCALFLLRAQADLIDIDQPLADSFGRRISLLDQGFDLFAGLWIAAFEPLLFAVGTKLRIVERRHHSRAQRSEAISGNTRRSHERTTEAE